ncbi:hypothetical protein SGI36_21425, partial [Providencia rettgeri]
KKTISNVKLYLSISVFSTDNEAKWMKLHGKYTKLRIHVKTHTQVLHCHEEILLMAKAIFTQGKNCNV